jgi:hypothetical protein
MAGEREDKYTATTWILSHYAATTWILTFTDYTIKRFDI